MTVMEAFNALGLALLVYRLWPRTVQKQNAPIAWPGVSIIVPARNEEKTLPALLSSLTSLDYPNFEIIVLNDQSTDKTEQIASHFPVKIINGTPKPFDWFGKPWACHQASLASTKDYLLFTDADTVHETQSLKQAMAHLLASNAQGMSAPPFHLNPSFWEKLLGPFLCFLLALTDPYGRPRSKRLFAIGQYLLFERSFYTRIGGHMAIREEAIDDISLAELTLAHGGKWTVFNADSIYGVRMYESLKDFIAGWRRNFRGGLKLSSKFSAPEAALYFAALTAVREPSWITLTTTLLSLIFLAWIQRRYGRFSVWGIFLFPLSLILFTAVTALAMFDRVLQKPLVWKNRSYPSGQVPNFPA